MRPCDSTRRCYARSAMDWMEPAALDVMLVSAGHQPARRGLFSLHMAACGGWPGEAARQTGTVGEEMTRWASCFLPFARTHRLLVLVYDPNFKILVACWLLFQGVFHIKFK
jgi:hypothetical protein